MLEQIVEYAQPVVAAFAGKSGFALQLVTVVGTARLFFKPIMEGIKKAVVETETKKDDEFLNKVENGKPYKIFCFLLDLFGSVKAPVVKAAADQVQKAVGPATASTEVKKDESK